MFWADRNGVLRVLLEDWEEQLIGERGPPDRQTWRNAAVRLLSRWLSEVMVSGSCHCRVSAGMQISATDLGVVTMASMRWSASQSALFMYGEIESSSPRRVSNGRVCKHVRPRQDPSKSTLTLHCRQPHAYVAHQRGSLRSVVPAVIPANVALNSISVAAAQAVMQLTDEQKRGIQAAWRVCMDQSRRVLQQREVALAELDMRGMSLQREGDFSLEMRKVRRCH